MSGRGRSGARECSQTAAASSQRQQRYSAEKLSCVVGTAGHGQATGAHEMLLQEWKTGAPQGLDVVPQKDMGRLAGEG